MNQILELRNNIVPEISDVKFSAPFPNNFCMLDDNCICLITSIGGNFVSWWYFF